MVLYSVGNLVIQSDLIIDSFSPFLINDENKGVHIRIRRAVCEPSAQKRNEYNQKLGFRVIQLSDDNWLYVDMDETEWLCVNNAYSELSYFSKQGTERMLSTFVELAVQCRMLMSGILTFHAACLEWKDSAIAFSGVSGMGKSTRAKQWVDTLGAQWISGDRPCVDVKSKMAIGCPWDGKEKIYRPVQMPLKYICDIRRSSVTRVRKMSDKQAYDFLVTQLFVPMWDASLVMNALMLLRKLVRTTTFVRLFCDRTPEAAIEAERLLFSQDNTFLEEEKDMKLKEGYVIRCVVDEYMAIPTGDEIKDMGGVLILNEVSAFILENMKNPISKEDLLELILGEYNVDRETASRDLDKVIEEFKGYGMIED